MTEYAAPGVAVARVLPGSSASSLVIELPALGLGPLHARTTVALDAAALQRAVVTGQAAIVAFENADLQRPIVIGLVQPASALSALETLLLARHEGPRDERPSDTQKTEARLDGKRLVLEGRDEVVLKCGESSITLRKDGKVVVRGRYVETHSRGVNRIKGTSVKIN